jgi:hypothetical protein
LEFLFLRESREACKLVLLIPEGIVERRTAVHPVHAFTSIGRDCVGCFVSMWKGGCDRGGVLDLSVSGDNFDLVEDDPHDPTTTSEPEAPMQSLNQLRVVTNLVDARSA